jgi:hypothetical protein
MQCCSSKVSSSPDLAVGKIRGPDASAFAVDATWVDSSRMANAIDGRLISG